MEEKPTKCDCPVATAPTRCDDGWKSRKFWVANSAAYATLVFAGTARGLDWINEATMSYLATTSLVAIALYCGFNLAEKLKLLK